MHELRQVLQSIAESQQVIVTTHSQALVNRRNLRQNVIVSERSAKPAKSLDALRTALGVRLSDALAAAEVVVVSEDLLDEILLPALLTQRESAVGEWLCGGRLIIESAGSGSKIYARVLAGSVVRSGARKAGCVDHDGVIEQTTVVQVVRPSCAHSELEDLLLPDSYLAALETRIGFGLKERQKRKLDLGRDKAWSERLAEILVNAGVPDVEKLVKACKYEVTQAAIEAVGRDEKVIRPECEDVLDRLVDLIRNGLHAQ